jgi:ABC-type Fe3+/spermidine/putrescine transport system ATPase subunit
MSGPRVSGAPDARVRDAPAVSPAPGPANAGARDGPPVTVQHAVGLTGVGKRFGDVVALRELSLALPPGRLITLLGPSGCGKTTLLRLIAGLEQPDTGTISIGGEDMRRRPPERRPVNMVFQRYALFPQRNVLENVLFGLQSARVKHREARDRALAALAMCRMDGYEERRIEELSGGQAQRVAVARALVNRPRVLLLDEPLAALDLKLRRHMQSELRGLQQELGMTFVYVTHDQDEALAMSDLIVLMDGGEVVQCAAPRDLYDGPSCVFAATFLGEANVLSGVLAHADGRRARVRVGPLDIAGVATAGLRVGEPAHVCVRPERISLTDGDSGLAATVTDVVFGGACARYTVALRDTDGRLVVEDSVEPGVRLRAIGEAVTATWHPDAARVLKD